MRQRRNGIPRMTFTPTHHTRRLMKKVGLFLRRPTKICLNCQPNVSDALPGIHLSRGRWLRRQLQHCRRLALA
jgi:hypothetical protein